MDSMLPSSVKMISHDVMGKCVSFLNKFLPLLTLPQPELRPQPLCLLFILGRVFISPGSKFTGDQKNKCLPSSNPLCVQQLVGEERAAGRQKLTATLPDAGDVYRRKCQNSQLP